MTEQAVLDQAAPAAPDAGETVPAPLTAGAAEPEDEALVAGDLLVEEVSIDGMCGVY